MGAIERFIEQHSDSLDVSAIISKDVERMEAPFLGPELYKYYSVERRSFSQSPTIRFTQRTALNDPFELTKRWDQLMSASTGDVFKSYLQQSLFGFIEHPDFVRSAALEHFASEGLVLSPDQSALLEAFLTSSEGKAAMRAHLEGVWTLFERALDALFSDGNDHFERTIEQTMSDMGIFSTSETPTNQQLWGLYASSGAGFVVAFDPHHEFFRRTSDGVKEANLFRKVRYDSSSVEEFIKNPFYLFLVKNAEWSFEREWRMLKRISDSDICVRVENGDDVHLFHVEPGMIRRIIFGYSYPERDRLMAAESLRAFDAGIGFAEARLNPRTRDIEVLPLYP
jgi:hypothetical protein